MMGKIHIENNHENPFDVARIWILMLKRLSYVSNTKWWLEITVILASMEV